MYENRPVFHAKQDIYYLRLVKIWKSVTISVSEWHEIKALKTHEVNRQKEKPSEDMTCY